MSFRAGGLLTLSAWCPRLALGTENVVHTVTHHLWRVFREGFPFSTCASSLLVPACLQPALGRTVARVQLGVKMPGLGAPGREMLLLPYFCLASSFIIIVFSVSLCLLLLTYPSCTSRRTEEQDCQGRVKLAWILLPSCFWDVLAHVYEAHPID